jgi:hypothetical protein
MPNIYLHPNEIIRFYEIWEHIFANPSTFLKNTNNGYQIKLINELRILIQKIDNEKNPLIDEFKLSESEFNIEVLIFK